jgi:threonine 3-dehydrogenase
VIALKKCAPEQGLQWCPDTAAPEPGPRDVVIAVSFAGVCGTDHHIYDWDSWSAKRVPIGITIGHEFVGRIVSLGSAVERFSVGQRVSGEGHIGCGVCHPCRTGNGHICEQVDIIGVDRDGCFAELICLPETNVWPVHDSVPDHVAAILDPIGNAVHTVSAAQVSGRSVLITGAGVIGLMATAVAVASGASSVFVVDVEEARLAQAAELGATHGLLAGDPEWPAQVRRHTGGQGPEVLLEMSGAASAIKGGLRALRNGGTAALLGLPSSPVELDLAEDIIFKGISVLGINGRRLFETWYQVEELLVSGRLRLDALSKTVLAFDDFERAFKSRTSAETTKVLFEMPGAR